MESDYTDLRRYTNEYVKFDKKDEQIKILKERIIRL